MLTQVCEVFPEISPSRKLNQQLCLKAGTTGENAGAGLQCCPYKSDLLLELQQANNYTLERGTDYLFQSWASLGAMGYSTSQAHQLSKLLTTIYIIPKKGISGYLLHSCLNNQYSILYQLMTSPASHTD